MPGSRSRKTEPDREALYYIEVAQNDARSLDARNLRQRADARRGLIAALDKAHARLRATTPPPASEPDREGLRACPIDGRPAQMLAGNCGHSWSPAPPPASGSRDAAPLSRAIPVRDEELREALTPEELEVLPRIRLDVDRYDAFRSEDVRVLLDIIDRLDRLSRAASPSAD